MTRWEHRSCAARRAKHGARYFFSYRQPARGTAPALGAARGANRDSVNLRKDVGAYRRQPKAGSARNALRRCTGAAVRRRLPDARLARNPCVRCTADILILNSAAFAAQRDAHRARISRIREKGAKKAPIGTSWPKGSFPLLNPVSALRVTLKALV
jgi:hypothetical protein